MTRALVLLQEIFRLQDGKQSEYTVNSAGQSHRFHTTYKDYRIVMDYNYLIQDLSIYFLKNDSFHAKKYRGTEEKEEDYRELIQVISRIFAMIRLILQTYPAIETISFLGETREASRIKLYTHLAKHIAKEFHGSFEVIDHGQQQEFVIILPSH